MNDHVLAAVPQGPGRQKLIISLILKSIICLISVSAICGSLAAEFINFTDQKNSDKTVIIIDENDTPQALKYYDVIYKSTIPGDSGINTDPAPDLYSYGSASVADGENGLLTVDLSRNNFQLLNETGYNPDIDVLVGAEITLPKRTAAVSFDYAGHADAAEEPLVLILHTHGTESYADERKISYKPDYGFRSDNINENVVAVGSVMANEFIKHGIPAIHCDIMHDKESYYNSYKRSAETINYYLDKYPTIICVLDIHRDALTDSDGNILRPVTAVATGGKTEPAAQIMSVVGTDYRGAIHPEWENNLILAAKLQSALDINYKNLARPLNLRGAAFNQQYAPLSLLLEIGSTGNTLAEAKRSGKIVAGILAGILADIIYRGL
jgi:stage II sporulation protein P